MSRARPATAAELGDGTDRLVDVNAPEVAPQLRAAVLQHMQPGDQLWRCPRRGAPRGLFGLGQRQAVIEWWLVSAEGHLIEVFWEEE